MDASMFLARDWFVKGDSFPQCLIHTLLSVGFSFALIPCFLNDYCFAEFEPQKHCKISWIFEDKESLAHSSWVSELNPFTILEDLIMASFEGYLE
jgi:hypothetical protein